MGARFTTLLAATQGHRSLKAADLVLLVPSEAAEEPSRNDATDTDAEQLCLRRVLSWVGSCSLTG